MAKYNLVIKQKGKICEKIITGKLKDIDNFIYKNKFKNIDEMITLLNNLYNYDITGNISLEIVSEQTNIKNRPILFTNELEILYQDYYKLRDLIFDTIKKDSDLMLQFEEKFIVPLLEQNTKAGIKASKFYKDNINNDLFNNFYDSIILTKNKNTSLRKKADRYDEIEEIEKMLTPNYSIERKMIELILKYYNKLPRNNTYIREKDEFDELLSNDNNSDIDRIKGIEKEQEEKIFTKLFERKIKSNDGIQTSIFDNN